MSSQKYSVLVLASALNEADRRKDTSAWWLVLWRLMRVSDYELFGIDTNSLCLGLVKGSCSVDVIALKARVTTFGLQLIDSKFNFLFL